MLWPRWWPWRRGQQQIWLEVCVQAQNAAGIWEHSHTEQEQRALFIVQVTLTQENIQLLNVGKQQKTEAVAA